MTTVPFHTPDITNAEKAAVFKVMSSSWLTTGKETALFERMFAEHVRAKHAVAVNSGTTGCLALLMALELTPQHEVIVPVWTFTSPAMMVHMLGAKVVFVDVDKLSYMPSLATIQAARTPNTRAVIVTHFAGDCHPQIAELQVWCRAEGIALLEDAAHAFPTRSPTTGVMVGSKGPLATFFSFYATKTLTTAEGGMVTTDSQTIATRVRQFVSNGISKPSYARYTDVKASWFYDVTTAGVKGNLPDLLSAMGVVQLERAGVMRMARSVIADRYSSVIDSLGDIGFVHSKPVIGCHAWHLYPVQVPDAKRFIIAMGEMGVQCSKHFIPMHKHTFWKKLTKGSFPVADGLHNRQVSLPIFSAMKAEQIDLVTDAMKEAWRKQ